MAVDNPQAQYGNDPNYLNYPHIIDAPEVNQAGAIGVKTLGTAIEGSAKFIDEAIKQGISDTAHAKVDPERDQFTSGLKAIKRGLDAGTITRSKTASGGSLLDAMAQADDTDLPPGLEAGIDRVTQMSQAYAAGSPKLNDTQYSAATLSIAKQMRAQYPGYRDEVDAAVSKASGLPVANSYYQNLMTDINRQLVQMNKANKDDMPAIMKQNFDVPGDPSKGVPNMGVMYQLRKTDPEAYQRIGGDAFVLDNISKWRNLQTQQGIQTKQNEQSTFDDKVKKDKATESLTKQANDTVAFFVQNNVGMSGMAPLRDEIDYVSQVNSTGKYNGVPQGSTEVDAHRQMLAGYRQMIVSHLKDLTAHLDPTVGAKEAEEIRQKAMSPIDGWLTVAGGSNPNPALADYQMRQNKNIQEDVFNNMLINKDTGAATRMVLNARKVYGDAYLPYWVQKTDPQVQEKLDGIFQQEKLYAVTNGVDARGQPLPPRALKEAVQHAKTIPGFDPNLIGGYIGVATSLSDPNMPQAMKDSIVTWAFQPKNRGLMDEISKDYRDKDGNLVPGKFAAIQRLFSPVMTQAVAETAKHNPEAYKNYRDLADNSFVNAFRGELLDLNKIIAKPYLNAHFGWDDQTGHFLLVDKNNRPMQPNYHTTGIENPNQIYLNEALDKLKRVNEMGIDNLTRVFVNDPTKPVGTDIGTYLLNTIQKAGLRNTGEISGASEGMAKAIIKTKKPEATLEDMDKILGLR